MTLTSLQVCGVVHSCTAIHCIPRWQMGELPLDTEVSCDMGFGLTNKQSQTNSSKVTRVQCEFTRVQCELGSSSHLATWRGRHSISLCWPDGMSSRQLPVFLAIYLTICLAVRFLTKG